MTISNTFTATAVEDGITYQIETTVGSVTFPADTQQITLATANISFYYKEGSAAREALSCYSCAFLKRGTSYVRITDTSKYTRAYNSKGTSAGIRNLTLGTSDNAIVICIYSNPTTAHSGYLAELEIPIYKQGNTGARGKMSRNPYYAGKMSEIGGTQFVANDYSTPYVDVETGTEDHPVCYIYIGSNGTQTFPSNVQGYSDSQDWEIMTSSFKYIIANMMFTSFARMGRWIVNGNFLYSAKGLDGNGIERNYEDGYVFIGKGNQNNTYTPNIWMDAFNGESFFSKGTIGGFTISQHQIESLNGKIVLKDEGTIVVGNAGQILVGNTTGRHIKITTSNGKPAIIGFDGSNNMFQLYTDMINGREQAILQLTSPENVNGTYGVVNITDLKHTRTIYTGGREFGDQFIISEYYDGGMFIKISKNNQDFIKIGITAGNKIVLGGTLGDWPTRRSDVNIGEVFRDGEVLRVREN